MYCLKVLCRQQEREKGEFSSLTRQCIKRLTNAIETQETQHEILHSQLPATDRVLHRDLRERKAEAEEPDKLKEMLERKKNKVIS